MFLIKCYIRMIIIKIFISQLVFKKIRLEVYDSNFDVQHFSFSLLCGKYDVLQNKLLLIKFYTKRLIEKILLFFSFLRKWHLKSPQLFFKFLPPKTHSKHTLCFDKLCLHTNCRIQSYHYQLIHTYWQSRKLCAHLQNFFP